MKLQLKTLVKGYVIMSHINTLEGKTSENTKVGRHVLALRRRKHGEASVSMRVGREELESGTVVGGGIGEQG